MKSHLGNLIKKLSKIEKNIKFNLENSILSITFFMLFKYQETWQRQ